MLIEHLLMWYVYESWNYNLYHNMLIEHLLM